MQTEKTIVKEELNIEQESKNDLRSNLLDVIIQKINNQPRAIDHPYITLSYAQSLNGCISSEAGKPLCLSNDKSMAFTHHLRSLHDCILIGINTVLSDDPRLTVRLVEGEDPQPIILDTHLKTPISSRLLNDVPQLPIIFCAKGADKEKERILKTMGAQIIHSALDADGLLDLNAILKWLKLNQFKRLMVEGGGKIISNFLANRLPDQVILTICPIFIDGVQSFMLNANHNTSYHRKLADINTEKLSGDLVIRGDLK